MAGSNKLECTTVNGPSMLDILWQYILRTSSPTCVACSRVPRYCTKRRKNARKCSARRMLPGTASARMSAGSEGFASQLSLTDDGSGGGEGGVQARVTQGVLRGDGATRQNESAGECVKAESGDADRTVCIAVACFQHMRRQQCKCTCHRRINLVGI